MRKFTLLIASLFITIGAMAQTFVEPEVGKFYKIKGDHETNHWVAVTTAGSSVAMSSSEESAAVFFKTENGFQEVTTKNYLGYTGGKFTFSSTALTVELRNTGEQANSEGKYAIVSGGNYMYNNSTDGIAHESTAWLNIPRLWGFVEVEYDDAYNGKIFRLTTYSGNNFDKYLYQKIDGTTDLYYNGTTDNTQAYWKFEMVTMGAYKIKNVHTGLYIDVLTGNNDFVNMSEAAPGQYEVVTQVGNETSGNGKYYIKKVGVNCSLHSTDGSGKVKGWEGGGLGNQYIFTEVDEFSHTLNVTDAGWATIVLGFNAIIPDGVTAYTIASQEDGYVTLKEVTGVLQANVPVLVNAPQGNYGFVYTTEAATVTESGLQGTLYNKNIAADAYVLGIPEGETEVCFAKAKLTDGSFLNNANKAYFVPTSGQANAASYSFRFGEGTTGINEVKGENGNVKAIFDLTGRRVENISAPGIYIVGGKKVLVK